MSTQGKVSLPVIKRLPKYYRYLNNMQRSGITKVSSSELARVMGTTASQVRQDFNCFGGFGQQGIGYNVEVLLAELGKLLFGDGKLLPTILIGTGRLGTAVSSFLTRDTNGYKLVGAFDASEEKVGRLLLGEIPVRHVRELEDFCRAEKPSVAVLCVPREGARELSSTLVDLGIRGFWNFSHYDLSVPYPDVTVENVHLGDSLMSLGYRLRNDT